MPEAKHPEEVSRFRRFSRACWRTTKWLMLIVVVLAVVYIMWTNIRGKRAASQMLQQLSDRGIPPIATDRLPSTENAARYYLAAAELLALDPPEMHHAPYFSSTDWPKFGEGLTPAQADLLRRAVDANPLLTQTLDQIKPGDHARFDLDASGDLSRMLDVVAKSRRLARWYELDALQATAAGDPERAVKDCRAIQQLSGQFVDDDYLIVALVRISIAALGQNAIESLLSRSELTGDQLRDLRDALSATRGSFDYPRTLRFELSMVVPDLLDPQWQIAQRDFNARRITSKLGRSFENMTIESFEEDWLKMSLWERISDAAVVTFAAWCPGQVRLSRVDDARRILAFHDRLTDTATDGREQMRIGEEPATRSEHKHLMGGLRACLKIDAKLSAAMAAMDVEQFRLREGRWPDDLTEVYDHVPTDGFGQPLKILSRGDELRVYSIGPNGIDDAGIQEHDDGATSGEEDDLVFVLLNTDQRNRPPTTVIKSIPDETIPEPYSGPGR